MGLIFKTEEQRARIKARRIPPPYSPQGYWGQRYPGLTKKEIKQKLVELEERHWQRERDRQDVAKVIITAHVCSNPLSPECTEPVYSQRPCAWCGSPRVPIRPPGFYYRTG